MSSTTLRRAYKVHPVDAVQIEYSPLFRQIEGPEGTDLLATCRELGVAVVAYSPLSRGLLTGTLKQASDMESAGDWRASNFPIFNAENLPGNVRVAAKFGELASKKGCTPSQLALAWLLRQGDDVVPIPGTKKIKYLEENLAALEVPFSEEDEKELRAFLDSVEIGGTRYGENSLKITFGDTKEE